ncbi:MAG: hypothetical protein B7Y41_13220 [Hydrogenophilales bacterium 28-61-23]|nr:MAG: hypothetical protein B7Y41_13220 [Hydrogenophilales bacterium 28-61-23]
MNRSPLIFSFFIIASLSLLNIDVAWSAAETQAKRINTASVKAKSAKAQTAKANTAKAKTSRSKAGDVKTSLKMAPMKLASADSLKFAPAAASAATINPYFANQPAAILPLAAKTLIENQAVNKVAPAPVAPVASAPTVSTPAISPAEPTNSAPIATAPAPAPVPATLPSLVPPSYAQAAPVAANEATAPVAAYQPWNMATAGYKNPYLAYSQPAYAPQDPGKLASEVGNSLKAYLPSLPQFGNSAPASMASPMQGVSADRSNSVGGFLSGLKMMLPLTGDANILPTIKKVYPTGEKPLVVINFKCPTELIGITPPPMKLLHEAINFGFDGLNKTNLLSFNLQQVCS